MFNCAGSAQLWLPGPDWLRADYTVRPTLPGIDFRGRADLGDTGGDNTANIIKTIFRNISDLIILQTIGDDSQRYPALNS